MINNLTISKFFICIITIIALITTCLCPPLYATANLPT